MYTTLCMFVYHVALQALDDILNEDDELSARNIQSLNIGENTRRVCFSSVCLSWVAYLGELIYQV